MLANIHVYIITAVTNFFLLNNLSQILDVEFLLPVSILSAVLSSLVHLKHLCSKQCGPRSDCSYRSSLIRVHTVCLYAKIRPSQKHF